MVAKRGQPKQRWISPLCSWVPLGIWHRLTQVRLVVPHWHLASDQEVEHVSGLYKYRDIRQFRSDLEFFVRHYTPVSLQDVIGHLEGSGRLPERCFLATFDDGLREIHEVVAPILHAWGIPAVFFLVTSVVDNYVLATPHKKSLLLRALQSRRGTASELEAARILCLAGAKGADVPAQIRGIYHSKRRVLEDLAPILDCDFADYVASVKPYLTSSQIVDLMRKGFDIGAHSVDHPLFSELTVRDQLDQTSKSLLELSTRYKFRCHAFAFPYFDGDVSSDFFKLAFSDGTLRVSFGTGGVRRHFYPRNLSRFTIENTELSAEQILALQFGKALQRGPMQAVPDGCEDQSAMDRKKVKVQ